MKRVLLIIGLLLLIISAINYQLISYGFSQLSGQLHIILNTKPVEEVLKDNSFPDSLKDRLEFIQKVRRFAIDSLGLKDSKNYTTIYDQQGKPVLMVLTASDAFRIKPYQWHFPFLGDVPYKGFFNFERGRKEEAELKSKGYDTDYGEITAWSTLGWFKDPILSGMLDRSYPGLAELIIHELTHSTLYVKDNVNFNENLANFIGEQGAIRFYEATYGKNDSSLKKYLIRLTEYDALSAYLVNQTNKLDSFYTSIVDFPESKKMQLKDSALAAIVSQWNSPPVDTIYLNRIIIRRKLNNAYLLNFVRYDAQKETLRNEFVKQYHSDFPAFLEAMKARYSK